MRCPTRVDRWVLVFLPMMFAAGCSGSTTATKHEGAQIRYLEGPTRFCLKGLAPWPTGDLPPLEAAPPGSIEGDGAAEYEARLLDELDARRRYDEYVVAWCVRPAHVETTAHEFRQPDAAECETDGSGECADVPQGTSPVTP